MPLVPFLVSLLLGLALMPAVRWLSFRLGKISAPREDRWHRKPTPTLGGIGIFAAFILAVLIVDLTSDEPVPWGLLGGAAIIFFIGILDDLRPMTPPMKLMGQILGATVIVLLGYTTSFFSPKISDSILAQLPNILLTYVWLVGITNAINLLDNMDGLAGGISLIAAVMLSFFFWQSGSMGYFAITVALAGSLLAFLVFNFPPASIFMGDSGALFLGFILATLAIARQPQASDVFAVMGVPTLLFLLPILDTSLVTITRLLRGQSPVQGGRDHTSHRLIAFGLTERQAVVVMYAVAILSGLAGIALEALDYWFSLLLVPALVVTLSLLTAYLGRLKVVSAAPAPSRGAITRLMAELTYKRRLLEVVLDFFIIALAYYLATLTQFGAPLPAQAFSGFLDSLPLALAGAYLSLALFGVYRGVWRYVGVNDLTRYVMAGAGSVLLMAAVTWVWKGAPAVDVTLLALFAVFLVLGLAASRLSFRLLDQLSGQRARPEEARVLILGAGDAGEMALRWIQMNPDLHYRPVGFLDSDPYMAGKQIHGVQILGNLEQLAMVLEARQIQGVVMTSGLSGNNGTAGTPGVDGTNGEYGVEEILAVCRQRGCWVRTLRLEFELLVE